MTTETNPPAAAPAGYRALRVERAGAIAEVVLTGSGKGNAMGPDAWRELPEVFDALDADDSVRAVVLRGAGAHFCYGLDLPAMLGGEIQVGGEQMAAERTSLYDQVLRMQRAGNSIAACDVRLCSADARFSLREVRMAIVADMGSLQRLPPIIGQGHTRELALTGKDIDAAHAARIGLVNEVCDTPEAALAAARALAEQIAANPPLVVQGVKRVLNECQGKSVEDGLRYGALWNAAFMQSHDLGEALAAFMQRRPPEFTGR